MRAQARHHGEAARMSEDSADRFDPRTLIAFVCAAQVLVQIGAFFWPALVPEMIARWRLTNSEAGWITAAFYGAYMLAVPVLVTLTDRIDPKRVYLGGVAAMVLGHALFAALADGFWSALAARALTGIGWAGTYMTGLKLLADKVDATMLSRAAAGHAASIGISGALSYVCADLLASSFGWRFAFAAASASAVVAWMIIVLAVPRAAPRAAAAPGAPALFDFRPVLRNRSAMAYAIAYGLHTLEMAALRGWGVAFLAAVAARTGTSGGLLSPTVTLTVLALLGTLASLAGNEAAIRFGRRTLVTAAIGCSVLLAVTLALFGVRSYPLAVALMLLYGAAIWLDSASLTAGTAGTAEPARRGATLAVHSTLGYFGGFIGPLAVGWVLDLGGGNTVAWSAAFGMIAAIMVASLVAFVAMRPRGLAGDRGA
jgi:predicted MFS family arabinose efflux permease